MNNNDVLRSFRYALDVGNATLLSYFAESGVVVAPRRLAGMLKGEEEEGFEPLSDAELSLFLDGLVAKRRGRREPQPSGPSQPEAPLSNNHILRALRIALELKDTDVLAIMDLAGFTVSKTELSALFRREDHRNYQPCGNQFLRNFLRGLALWHRQGRTP